MSALHSALYEGTLRHRRSAPVCHAFEYPLTLAWLDLGELDDVFRSRWLWSTHRPALAWLRRSDYLGDASVPLEAAVRDRVERELGWRPAGPIRLLTHLRTFGHSFNPVSFYYCYDARGEHVEAIVAEITNTPWGERHAYVLSNGSNGDRPQCGQAPVEPDPTASTARVMRFRFDKRFRVSPFMPMQLEYDWRFTRPADRLIVHMANLRDGVRIFDSTLRLSRREISGASLAATLARYPAASLRVLVAIYWQAFRLWSKRVPLHEQSSLLEEHSA